MKIFTIIAGINGVGKSSLTGVLRSQMSDLGIIIDVDQIIARTGDVLQGGKEAVRKINDCLKTGISFTQETTLSGHMILNTVRTAKESGYRIRMYYIGLDSVEESLCRIENRVRKGGHDIPSTDVRRRYKDRFTYLIPLLPYCDEAVFYDNETGFRMVAGYRNGELFRIGDQKCLWLDQLLNMWRTKI